MCIFLNYSKYKLFVFKIIFSRSIFQSSIFQLEQKRNIINKYIFFKYKDVQFEVIVSN
jgi:hypothetical protein